MLSASDARNRASRIRLVGFDVDGILTDGRLWYDTEGGESKAFHVLDGMGLKLLSMAGIRTCVISARPSAAAARRLTELGVEQVVLGAAHKRPAFERMLSDAGLSYAEAAFMGDDLPDLAILSRVALAATVASAFAAVRTRCHWCATRPPGQGAVRELAEFILEAQGQLEPLTAGFREGAP